MKNSYPSRWKAGETTSDRAEDNTSRVPEYRNNSLEYTKRQENQKKPRKKDLGQTCSNWRKGGGENRDRRWWKKSDIGRKSYYCSYRRRGDTKKVGGQKKGGKKPWGNKDTAWVQNKRRERKSWKGRGLLEKACPGRLM